MLPEFRFGPGPHPAAGRSTDGSHVVCERIRRRSIGKLFCGLKFWKLRKNLKAKGKTNL
jgi:hypothetical protein